MNSDAILDFIKRELVIVDKVPKGPSYILPNGFFIDIYNSGFKTHGNIDEWLLEEGYLDIEDLNNNGGILTQLNLVRVNDGSNFGGESLIDLPEYLTKNQLYSIEDWLNIQCLKKSWVDVGAYSFNMVPKTFLFKEDDIKDIIRYIKKLYL